MAFLKDSEGKDIERNLDKNPDSKAYFDVDLCDFADGKGPILGVGIPWEFVTIYDEVYSSCGLISVPLKKVMNEYKKHYWQWDNGKGTKDFVKYLRKYADDLEKDFEKFKKERNL